MKITRVLILVAFVLVSQVNLAQDASPSPYSFFGLGDTSFRGTVENYGMGGLHFYADSLHYSINSPASLARLKYVSLSLGMGNNFIKMSDATQSSWASTHGVSYFSLGIPIGKKFGIGFGLLPVSSSGFQIITKNGDDSYTYQGKGGNTRLFLAGGYQFKDFSFGLEYQYYFGYFDHQNYWFRAHTITYTRENNQIDFTGSTLKFSTNYHYKLDDKSYMDLGVNYKLASKLDATYQKNLRLVTVTTSNGEETVEELESNEVKGKINYPAELDFGVGYGKNNKWFVGAEYNYIGLKDFDNPFYDAGLVTYTNAYAIRLGANWTPKFNSITSYWDRVTYRLGFNYKSTGMIVHNEPISDFGITFGLGLPSLRGVSKMNIGLTLGQRGKIAPQLVKENYANLQISLSLNDRWFIKRKIN